MGLTRKSNLKKYWTRNRITEIPFFGKYMSKNAFMLLLGNIHLNDNSKEPKKGSHDYDPLWKLRPFVDLCFDRFHKVYKPERELAFDEGACPWKGRLSFRVYNPNKPNKFHIKLFQISESCSGYISGFNVYCGKENRFCSSRNVQTLDPTCTKTTKTVLGLLKQVDLLGKGYHVYMDNYYTSPELFNELYLKDTYACGTVRKNRKGLPKGVGDAKLKKGEGVFRRNGPLLALKWCDKRAVYLCSTIHEANMVEVAKFGEPDNKMFKPLAIQEYVSYMRAVDVGDQMMSYNCFVRRSLKWWRKLFIHFLNMVLLNSYILHKKFSGVKMGQEEFREGLVAELLKRGIQNCMWSLPPRVSNRSDDEARISERHFPSHIPCAVGAKRSKPVRKCFVCSKLPTVDGVKLSKYTSYWCEDCKKPLCIHVCFKTFHTVADYKTAVMTIKLNELGK